jgi:hypothetical protein
MSMWEPFTKDARQSIVLAQKAAAKAITKHISPVRILPMPPPRPGAPSSQ